MAALCSSGPACHAAHYPLAVTERSHWEQLSGAAIAAATGSSYQKQQLEVAISETTSGSHRQPPVQAALIRHRLAYQRRPAGPLLHPSLAFPVCLCRRRPTDSAHLQQQTASRCSMNEKQAAVDRDVVDENPGPHNPFGDPFGAHLGTHLEPIWAHLETQLGTKRCPGQQRLTSSSGVS